MTTILEPTLQPGTGAEGVGTRVLGPNGQVAQNLPGYEARRPQMEMADLCEQVLQESGQALIEAGTGTGKSLAYLVPAIESGQRVIVSTESIQLQEQLIRKDLPFLERALGRRIRFAIAKGRSNYFCERNTVAFIQDAEGRLLDTDGPRDGLEIARDLMAAFCDEWDGNKATLRVQVPDLLWTDFAGDDSCTGAGCPNASDCAYLEAKREFEQADVVITNHHYYLLHHYVKARSGGIIALLPEHRVWIADEAHSLADIAQNVFGAEIRQGAPRRFVTKLLRQLKALKLELDIEWNVPEIEQAADAFFDCFRGALKDEQLWREFPPEVIEDAAARMQALVSVLSPIRVGLHKLGRDIPPDDEETRRALRRLRDNADDLIDGLQDFFREPTIWCHACGGSGTDDEQRPCEGCSGTGKVPDPDPPVQYVEITLRGRDRSGRKHVTLHRKPTETQRIFKSIYRDLDTVLFTSATLATGGTFGPIAEELGVNAFDVETLQAKSPFDYSHQVRGYFPKSVPDGKSPEYHDRLADEILRIVEWTGGRAFILFTANRDLRAVQERLAGRCPYPLLAQGDMPKDLLIEEFRREPSVLLGVRTFWTGVDIPGQALSCVVLVKFPFPQPEAPLVKARCERIEARGRRSFDLYSLPRAIRDIQQGFGRLIRSRSDRGLFAILDSRWHTAKYARIIERSLPGFPKSEELPTDWSLDDAADPTHRTTEEERGRPTEHQRSGDRDASAARSDKPAGTGVPGELFEVVRPADAPPQGLSDTGAGRAALRARSYDRAGRTGAMEAGRGVEEPAGVGAALEEAPALAGAAEGDRGGAAPGKSAVAPATEARGRFHFLRAYALAGRWNAPDGGTGGPLCGRLTDDERRQGREAWDALVTQWRRYAERCAWLYDHQDDSEWDEVNARTERSGRRFGEMRDALAEWTGATDADISELLEEAINLEMVSERSAA